jgi:succinate dehydrogenase/fumarate reductase-like Fe-S protein
MMDELLDNVSSSRREDCSYKPPMQVVVQTCMRCVLIVSTTSNLSADPSFVGPAGWARLTTCHQRSWTAP